MWIPCAMLHMDIQKHDLPHCWRRCSCWKKIQAQSGFRTPLFLGSLVSNSVADFRSNHFASGICRCCLFLLGVLPHHKHRQQVIIAELASSLAQPCLAFAGIPELLGNPFPVRPQPCFHFFFEAVDASTEGLREVRADASCKCGCTASKACGSRGGNRAIRSGRASHGDQS